MIRAAILDQARECICVDRQATYGDPHEHFTAVANVWSVLLGVRIEAHQVPLLMAGLKLVRASINPKHIDSWVDLAGYAALAGEIGA